MAISDIIRTDDDRLFIVDPECYIVFTGNDTGDNRPFIRVGTWLDLPAELIPLVENIIVTDAITGNPCHEQFNIDIIDLPANRYIGSTAGLRRFLDFQRFFGLDLTSATIVHIEKDLPELSREQKIAEGNQYIGVFYRNGNCIITHQGRAFFDLSHTAGNPLSPRTILDRLSEQHRNNPRYAGSGLVILGRNPLFYHLNRFIPYLMPFRCLGDFSRLGIDPSAIRTVLHPSSNIINLGTFLSWKNTLRGSLNLFGVPRDTAAVAGIFRDCRLKQHEFRGMVWEEGGLAVSNTAGTFNLVVQYGLPVSKSGTAAAPFITAAFIKTAEGLREILTAGADLLLVSLSAYEDVTLLLKTTDIPVLLIDDGDPVIRRLPPDLIVLRPGIHYRFHRLEIDIGQPVQTLKELCAIAGFDALVTERCAGDGAGVLALVDERLAAAPIDTEGQHELFNILALARHLYDSTTDRRIAARLRDVMPRIRRHLDQALLYGEPARCTVILALTGRTVIPIMAPLLAAPIALYDDDILDGDPPAALPGVAGELFSRIIIDRERLRALLALFVDSPTLPRERRREMTALKDALARRRGEFGNEWLALDDEAARPAGAAAGFSAIPAAGAVAGDGDKTPTGGTPGVFHRHRRLIVTLVPLLIAIIIALIATGINRHDHSREHARERPVDVIQSRDIDRQFRELGRQKNILVLDRDIYRYANEVAIRNGYRPIAPYPLREKNPDWIYPENVFVMLDGQKVVVSRGDTLWNLARNKLIGITIECNELLAKAGAAPAAERRKLLDRARVIAFTEEQRRRVDALAGPPAPSPKQRQ